MRSNTEYEIDVNNQHHLDENSRQSTCPLCSSSRRKKNERCCSLDWDRGLGTCHHCGETFQLHTYVKKDTTPKMKPYYAKSEGYYRTTFHHGDGTETTLYNFQL